VSARHPPPPVPLVRKAGRPPDPNRKCAVELRECTHHGTTEFAYYSRGNGERRWRCKRCVGEAVTLRKQAIKQLLVEESGGCCAVCGYDRCIINLTFHHVDPRTKSFGMSMRSTKALATYREELQKCVLVCANCHGEIEAGLMVGPPAGATFEDVTYRYARRGD
jgi:5-methylcytosine-specific restriction endonuclease McrA